jgi:ATP-binding cassette subfamily B protein
MKNWRYGEWILFWNGVFVHIFMGAMVLFAVYLAMEGVLAPSDVTLLLATVWLLEGYFVHLSQQFNSVSEVWGQITESLRDILEPQDVTDVAGAKPLVVTNGKLAFADVTFEYDGISVFKKLSFTLPPGERVGVIGRSGAGKSTLMKIIMRHYDLAGGAILIDDTDIAGVTKDSLRSSIAVVPQEPALFHRTIAENIAYGRPDATRKEIMRAAEQAQAHDFIMALPEKYESLVGERGIKLSGGQRQRIAIARALLKDAPILLLDEATSALDSESEMLVQEALLTLMEGRTVIAIAHRLSTLRAMDRLMIFDAGKIVEDGTHEELMARGGLYAELWNHQAGGFLTEDE